MVVLLVLTAERALYKGFGHTFICKSGSKTWSLLGPTKFNDTFDELP